MIAGCVAAVLASSASVNGQFLDNETFDTGPGGWTLSEDTSAGDDIQFAWSNTTNALGPSLAGEIGGLAGRTSGGRAYVGANIGALTFDDPFTATAHFFVEIPDGGSFDGADVLIGFFDRNESVHRNNANAQFAGLHIDNNVTVTTLWNKGSGNQEQLANPITAGEHFLRIVYDPNLDSDGNLTMYIDEAPNGNSPIYLTPENRNSGTVFNTFGLSAHGLNQCCSFNNNVWIDDVHFTNNIPEPTSMGLLALGGLLMLLRRRRA